MFNAIISGIVAIGIMVGGWLGIISPEQQKLYEMQQEALHIQTEINDIRDLMEQPLGSYYAVGGKYYRLWGSGITSSATSLILTSFKSPINDIEFTMTNFGAIGYGTIEPNNTSNVEFISFTGITQAADSDKCTLTGVSRGLNFVHPYTASSTLAKAHPGGSRFIISNPPMHYSEYASRMNVEYIGGDWTYSATNTPQYSSNPTFTVGSNEFCSVKYADDLAIAGSPAISTTTAGIAELADSDELIHFTTTTGSTNKRLVVQMHRFATSTDKLGATTTVVMTDSDGKIDDSFLALDDEFIFTADLSSNSSTTLRTKVNIGTSSDDSLIVDARMVVNSSTTIAAATTTVGLDVNDLLYVNASTTFSNATTTFDRPPRVLDNDDATNTDPYVLSTKSYVDSVAAIANASTIASSVGGSSFTSFTDVNLSPIVGTNEAMVYIRGVANGTGADQAAEWRPNGDSGTTVGGAGKCTYGANDSCYVWVKTDSSGIVELHDLADDGRGTTWTLLAFIRVQ